jgi:hypothetical protein
MIVSAAKTQKPWGCCRQSKRINRPTLRREAGWFLAATDQDRKDLTRVRPEHLPTMQGGDSDQQDTWIAIEDAWLRLAARCPVQLIHHSQCETTELVFAGFRDDSQNGSDPALRDCVRNIDTYCWQEGERRGRFVNSIESHGTDLVLQVTPLRQIKCWPDGERTAWQVESFLLRLQGEEGALSKCDTSWHQIQHQRNDKCALQGLNDHGRS